MNILQQKEPKDYFFLTVVWIPNKKSKLIPKFAIVALGVHYKPLNSN